MKATHFDIWAAILNERNYSEIRKATDEQTG